MTYPTRALSIQQPWAWMIVNGHKDIENRDRRTSFRGPVLIHAGKKRDRHARPPNGLKWPDEILGMEEGLGGIVGMAEIVDCVSESASPWFVGDYGFVIRNARPLPFMPLRGALGFFPATYVEP